MKTKAQFFVLPVLLFAATGVKAQCSGQASTISYDTTVTGLGNALYAFTFPKFDPTLGTLTDVKIDTRVTLVYNFQLENGELTAINNYRVRVMRDDEVSGAALQTPLTNSYQRTYGNYSLAGTDGITGAGTDFTAQGPLYVMNLQPANYTVYNTADYMGSGSVNFDYATATYSTVLGSVNNAFDGSAQDAMNFTITYTYCPASILATDIISFTAVTLDNGSIEIKWTTQNEKNNRSYDIQKSADGRNYRSITGFTATPGTTQTGSYRYSYTIQPEDLNKTLLFRLKQTEQDGRGKYSAVRIVKLSTGAIDQPRLYPNPAKGVTSILFSNNKRSNWDVEIYTAAGQLKQRYYFTNALQAKLNTNHELGKGVYMIKCINRHTREQLVQQLVVH